MGSAQFRVLYRHFLFRLMDVELLSASARGDSSQLLGQFGALLIFGSVVLSFGAITVGQAIRKGESAASVWSAERFLISLTMLTVGIFALVSWDSLFPDRGDVLVLSPLPVRGRTLFAAKVAAVASALGLTVAALNCLSGFAWPLMLCPDSAGLPGELRFVAAFWAALVAAAMFLYCSILAVHGMIAQLPRRWYLRCGSALQMAAFVLLLGVFCLQPALDSPAALVAPQNQHALAWLPSYWFLGLLSEWSGAFPAASRAVMPPLARRAAIGLSLAILFAAGAFLHAYLRMLRKIIEEPDLTPGSNRGLWLPRFGDGPQTGLAQFVIRTLMRSRQHRMILTFYLGGGFAIVALYLDVMREVMHLSGVDLFHRVNIPMLAASILMLCSAWMGTRTVFSLPLDLRANWLFRITPTPGGIVALAAIRRALLALSVFPVAAAGAIVLLWFWPWQAALQHLLLLALFGSLLADLSLNGFRKIPFTCSFLPGKSKIHLIFWFGVIPFVLLVNKAAGLEETVIASPTEYSATAILLAAAAFAARKAADRTANHSDAGIQFEESASDELIELGLNG